MSNWYIVQSHSSFENKVAQQIKDEADKSKVSDKIEEIIVPTHDVTEVRRGKRIQRKKKYFPGYVLIKCEMTDDIYHMIKSIKVLTFLLLVAGSLLIGDSLLFYTKGYFGQKLLRIAWDNSKISGKYTRAWSWSETDDRSFYKRNCHPFIMKRKFSLDLDTIEDWKYAKHYSTSLNL